MPPKTRGGTSTGIRAHAREAVDLAHEVMQVPLTCEPAGTASEGTSQANILFSLEPKATDLFFKMDVLMRFVEFGRNKFGVFKGQDDPREAYRWLRDVTETFEIMECPEEKRVKLAVLFIEDDAKDWWESITIVLGTNSSSWEAFREAFKDEYFSRLFQDELLQDFIDLRQDGRPVSQYIVEFQVLADIFPIIVPTEEARSDHFLRGLDPFIRLQLITVPSKNFKEVVGKARRAEKCEKNIARRARSVTPPKSQSRGYGPSVDQSQPTWGGSYLPNQDRKKPRRSSVAPGDPGQSYDSVSHTDTTEKACYNCGVVGHLARACPLNEVQCYLCKQMGHYRSHCPQKGK